VTITGHRYETNYNRAGAVTHELFGENVRALDPPDHHWTSSIFQWRSHQPYDFSSTRCRPDCWRISSSKHPHECNTSCIPWTCVCRIY
jgi:hypothetical protein